MEWPSCVSLWYGQKLVLALFVSPISQQSWYTANICDYENVMERVKIKELKMLVNSQSDTAQSLGIDWLCFNNVRTHCKCLTLPVKLVLINADLRCVCWPSFVTNNFNCSLILPDLACLSLSLP